MKNYITAAALLAAGTAFANAADTATNVTLSTNVSESATSGTTASYGFSASLDSDWLKGWSDDYTGLNLTSVSVSVKSGTTWKQGNTAKNSAYLAVGELTGSTSVSSIGSNLKFVGLSNSLNGSSNNGTLKFSFSGDGVKLDSGKDYVFLYCSSYTGTIAAGNFTPTYAYATSMISYLNSYVGTTSTTEGFVAGGGSSYSYNYQNGASKAMISLAGTAIPEPSAFGLLAGAGALALVAARRRRQKKA